MRKIWELLRRRFLRLLSLLGLARATKPLVAASGAAASATGAAATSFEVMTAPQVALLEAIAEQIIPADQDPGVREAGVVHYIDRVLADEQSFRLPLYLAGLAGTDESSRLIFGHNFAELRFDQQTVVLKAVEQGDAKGETWKKVSSTEFFSTVWNHILEGFYGPPEHGGNKNYVSWKMVGFPEHSGTM